MPRTSITASAGDTWSDPIRIVGSFNVSIAGTFAAKVSVQRSEDGISWRTVDTWTTPSEDVGTDPILNYYRVGVAAGDYTSGTVEGYINGYSTLSD